MPEEEIIATLALKGVVLDAHECGMPLDLVLRAGELAWIRGVSAYLPLLGIRPPVRGVVRFRGDAWADRDVSRLERDRRRIGVVVNPRSHSSDIWVSNLDIDENVVLAAQFDPRRSSGDVVARAVDLATEFGLADGLPHSRPVATPRPFQTAAQWARAFLPDPLDLLILENPLEFAAEESVEAFAARVRMALKTGTAVLWIAETSPPFSKLGLNPDHVVG